MKRTAMLVLVTWIGAGCGGSDTAEGPASCTDAGEPTTIGSVASPGALAIDDRSVYVSGRAADGTAVISAVPRAGGAAANLVEGRPDEVNPDLLT
jgi:hypothetical protein